MAFPNPFKRDPASPSAGSQEPRVEPRLGGGEAQLPDNDSPWVMPAESNGAMTGAASEPRFGAPAAVPSIQESAEPVLHSTRSDAPSQEPAAEASAAEPTPAAERAAPKKRSFWPFGKKSSPASTQTLDQASPSSQHSEPAASSETERTAEARPAAERARIPSDQELLARQKTRHRLVGAAALLMAAVIIAPLVLDSEKALEQPKVSTDIPPVTEAKRVEVPIEVPPVPSRAELAQAEESTSPNTNAGAVARVDTQVPPPSAAPAAPAAAAASAPAAPNVKAAVSDRKARAEKAAAEEAKQSAKNDKKDRNESLSAGAPTAKGYYVQVLAFGSEAKANAAVKRMREHGLPAYTQKVQGRNLWRVRVGVFKSRNEAQSAIGRLALIGYTEKMTPEQQ